MHVMTWIAAYLGAVLLAARLCGINGRRVEE